MDDATPEILVQLLRDCAANAPEPLYPGLYAQAHSLDRAVLDRGLDRLRLANLVRLTDWVQGRGQGYVPTDEGKYAAGQPNLLAVVTLANQLAAEGKLQPRAAPAETETDGYKPPAGVRPAAERREAVVASLPDVKPRAVSMTLVALNVAVFLFGAVLAWQRDIPVLDYYFVTGTASPALSELLRDLGNIQRLDAVGLQQWWRLFTHSFVHVGLLHLLMNMVFLYFVGPLIEGMWGRWQYLFLYLVSSAGGGLAVLLANSRASGASDALCGLTMSMLIWVLTNRRYLNEEAASRWLRNILTGIGMIVFFSLMPFVSTMGHLGGAVAGLAVAYPMTFFRFGTPRQRLLGLAGMLTVPAAIAGGYIGLELQVGDLYRFPLMQAHLAQADRIVVDTYNNEVKKVVPLIYPPTKPLPADTKELTDAAQRFARAADLIGENLDAVRRVPPLRDPILREKFAIFEEVIAEFEGFQTLYANLAQALEHPETLTADTRRRLYEDIGKQLHQFQDYLRRHKK